MSQTRKFVHLSIQMANFALSRIPLSYQGRYLVAAEGIWCSLRKVTSLSRLQAFKRKCRPSLNVGTESSITTIYSSIFPYINCANFSVYMDIRWTRVKVAEGFVQMH